MASYVLGIRKSIQKIEFIACLLFLLDVLIGLVSIIDAKTLEDKATFIKEQSSIGPVLVYCDASLTEYLVNLGCSTLMMEPQIDPEVLRHLDLKIEGSYKVIIAQDQFAMRGVDYRSTNATLTLVVAKSFENKRESIQGFNRVGRFGVASCQAATYYRVMLS